MRYILILLILQSTVSAQNLQSIPETKETSSPTKFPIPKDSELLHPENVIDEVFGNQIKAARTVFDQTTLAEEMLGMAKTSDDRFERYALIDQARELAVNAKSYTLAAKSIDLMAEMFLIDKEQLYTQAKEDIASGSEMTKSVITKIEALDSIVKADPGMAEAVADACYKLAKTLRGPIQETVKEKAITYYHKAMPNLSALEKKRAEMRIEELETKKDRNTRRNVKNADLDYLVGVWEVHIGGRYHGFWVFLPDGTTRRASPAHNLGKWAVSKDAIMIQWQDQKGDQYDFLSRPLSEDALGDTPGSGKVTAKKIL